MSIEQTTNREKALRMAVDLETCRAKEDVKYDVLATAQGFLDFLDGTTPAAAPTAAGNVDPPPSTPAPKAARARKPAVATGPTAPEPSPAPAVQSPVATASPMADAPKAAGSAPNSKATLDDVRQALVKLQTRKNRAASQAILDKYTAPKQGVTGNLPESTYAAVITECDSQT